MSYTNYPPLSLTYSQLPVREITLTKLAAGVSIPGFTSLTLKHGDLVEWGPGHELRRITLGSHHFLPVAMSLHAVSEARDHEVEIAKSVSTYYYDLDTAPLIVKAHITKAPDAPKAHAYHPVEMDNHWHVVRVGPTPPDPNEAPEDPRL